MCASERSRRRAVCARRTPPAPPSSAQTEFIALPIQFAGNICRMESGKMCRLLAYSNLLTSAAAARVDIAPAAIAARANLLSGAVHSRFPPELLFQSGAARLAPAVSPLAPPHWRVFKKTILHLSQRVPVVSPSLNAIVERHSCV
ncbi:hypothetical protein EVAR_20607_1 [Eumeta japonica]|uniref:Uncharacterized protein n=1 Tax=Eumeta variegata TaxID=151549 RepID=A0A4C1UTU6_EUMVA|nr:hypothetical protein EVAR_20607_1 [Eumeta japonica]